MSSSPASIGADSDVPSVKSNESLYVVSSRAIKPSSSGSSYCLTIVTSCWFFMIRSISSASFSFTFLSFDLRMCAAAVDNRVERKIPGVFILFKRI